MDIVLDSNTYSSDYRMQSARFIALSDYLWKSNARLVLFRLVHDEVVENYRRNFQVNVLDPWNKVHGFLLTTQPRPDLDVELETLSQRLKNFASRVVFISDYTDVALEEVLGRGVKRIPPASKKGEELRDVVLWLLTLAYAKKEKREIVLITNDKGFWQEGADKPLDEIQADITNAHASLRLYRTVEAFLAENGLVAHPADPSWASQFFAGSRLAGVLLSRLVQAEYPYWTVTSHTVTGTEFEGGAVYDISSGAQFAELTFKVRFEIEFKAYSEITFSTGNVWRLHGDIKPGNIMFSGTAPVESAFKPTTVSLGYYDYVQRAITGSPPFAVPEPVAQKASVELRAKFSVRLTSGEPTEVILDNFNVLSMSPQSISG